MRYLLVFFFSCLIKLSFCQSKIKSCNFNDNVERHIRDGDDFYKTMEENEVFIQNFIKNNLAEDQGKSTAAKYRIPVVIHVFHDGEDGKVTMEQIESGLEVLNNDFQGLNEDWNDIDSMFDNRKEKMDIEFCLARIDPFGNPTTGVNYYQDPQGMLNEGELRVHAWDNYKYFNIYMPKYVWGEPSLFTAYAYFPSTSLVSQNMDGVFYSSIRWGYGEHSELEDGQDWASVITHEVGHWLDLRHTFSGGCGGGDNIDDTPPTLGGDIHTSGCYNNDFSCGEATNGSNYMDYNHDCKKMFTKGQVERMTAALHLSSRINLWSEANLNATGCAEDPSNSADIRIDKVALRPNPSKGLFKIENLLEQSQIKIYNLNGSLVWQKIVADSTVEVDLTAYDDGIYIFQIESNNSQKRGMIVKSN